jgi:NAD(P)-dependent dehydrogenase (short-subunit alcohol dehydrogenase family)
MQGLLAGKVAAVVGGGSGQGEATARLFAAEDAKVVVADVTGRQDIVAESIGDAAVAVLADVTKAEDIEGVMTLAVERFGRLDVLCNVAGVSSSGHHIVDCTDEEFMRQINVHLRGTFLGMKYGIARMLETGGGSVINWSSGASVRGYKGMNGYGAAKAAINQLTLIASTEYAGRGVRVNAIIPGLIHTPMMEAQEASLGAEHVQRFAEMTPIGRRGNSDEIAQAALFLASDASSFITGAILPVDGGLIT